MPKTLPEITRDAAELSANDRLKLARILLDISELDTEPTEGIEAAWEQEIERRIAELRSGHVQGIPLDKAKEKIEARFKS